jgi:predicted DNA-binding protein
MENKTLSVKISSEKYNKLKMLANKEGKFISWVLDKAIENYLRAKKVLKD